MDKKNDVQLINDFLKGDIGSFNRLVNRWQGKLYHFSYRYLQDEEEAKEVVQKALIKIYKNLKKLKNPEKFSSWTYQITLNLCRDTLKSSHKTRLIFENSFSRSDNNESNPGLDDIADDYDSSRRVHKSDLQDIVKMTLARLPEEQRVVIIMKEYDGFKFSEIAEILNCPVNTAKARMYYGLKRMQKIMKNLNIDMEVLFNEM
ncbi:RNA polymerase sigma factor [candidate division KSB1 bacterium]